MKRIVQKGAPMLRIKAKEVPLKDIMSPKIQKVLRAMREALLAEDDGAAIAAPQIAVPLRIFIVSRKVFAAQYKEEKGTKEKTFEEKVFINPTLTKIAKKQTLMGEGCLSVKGYYGTVKRAVKATVRAYDEQGKKFEHGGSGLLAQVFQHELDHLDGTLYTDKAERIEKLPSKETSNGK